MTPHEVSANPGIHSGAGMETYVHSEHRLHRLRIQLTVPASDAERLTDTCSRLFHQRLTTLLADILEKVQQALGDLCITEALTLNLGALPLRGFEQHFCMRLEEQLPALLQGYGRRMTLVASSVDGHVHDRTNAALQSGQGLTATSYARLPQEGQTRQALTTRPEGMTQPPVLALSPEEMGPAGTTSTDEPATDSVGAATSSEALARFGHFLETGSWPTPEPGVSSDPPETVDHWLLRHLGRAGQRWVPQLAMHCLTPTSLHGLQRTLQAPTLQRLCQYLTPSYGLPDSITAGTLMLYALHYFQQHPQKTLPPAWPQEQMSSVVLDNERLLTTLFQSYLTAPPQLASWLRTLFALPATQRSLQRQLGPEAFAHLQRWAQVLPGQTLDHRLDRGKPVTQGHVDRMGAKAPSSLIDVSNSGITLLWPLLPELFKELGLWHKGQFTHPQARQNAVYWLDEFVWADQQYAEERLPLNRLLFGLPLNTPLQWELPGAHERQVMQQWLSLLPQRLSAWKRLGPMDIRQLFLQRRGWLSASTERNLLYVQPETYDVLLAEWAWPTNMLMLPWLEQPLAIQWNSPPVP